MTKRTQVSVSASSSGTEGVEPASFGFGVDLPAVVQVGIVRPGEALPEFVTMTIREDGVSVRHAVLAALPEAKKKETVQRAERVRPRKAPTSRQVVPKKKAAKKAAKKKGKR